MNSTIASNINGGSVINQQVANGSQSSLLLSSIDFSLSETKKNFAPPSNQGRYLIKLSGKEELLNGQNKNWNQNKNSVENSSITINGNKEKTPEDTIAVPKVQLYTGKIHVEWNQVYKIGAGLNNLGNTCFMNTVIQCLTYCPPLANYLLHDNDHSSKCIITGFCMMCLLQRHMKRAIGKTGEVIKPVDVYQRLKLIAKHFQFGRQEDAHEFLRYVIDHLWKSCLPQTNGVSKLDSASKETTVINKIFGGYHRSQVICLKCKKESNTFDHFMDFILDIKQNVISLEKALEKFSQPELLQHENCYKCPKCKMKVEAQKRFSVYQAPTVATFQLKRFDYNRTFGGKITKQISYPEKLNLRSYMSETKGEPVWYRLNAVLVHSGPSCNSGHYFCYVKNSNGFWYIMDDQRVSQVSLNQVLNQSAYVLFYIKVENGEKASLKKNMDIKSSFLKGVISNNRIEKSPSVKNSLNSFKPSPLSEKSPFANSNQLVTSPSIVKKFNSVSASSREKVSFGFRAGLSPNAFTPKSKNLTSATAFTPQGGLVPYVEDSDSSDAGESNQSQNKRNSMTDGKHEQSIKINLDSYNSSPRLEIKTKLSKSVFSNSSNCLTRAVPKVSVSGNWIVTDVSETASCSSSTSGANSSDWNVTAIDEVHESPSVSKNKDFGAKQLPEAANSSIEIPSSKLIVSGNSDHLPSAAATKLSGFENSLSAQKSNFRKQQPKFISHFSQNEETVQNSFKRKSCESYSKNSLSSKHSENRHSPVSKKIKYSEKSPFLTLESDIKNSGSNVKSFDGDNVATTLQQKHISPASGENNSRTQGTNGVFCPNKKTGLPLFHKDFNLGCFPENRKNSNIPERDSFITKGKHKEKNDLFETSKFSQFDKGKSDVSNQVKNNSIYGTEVPTWRGENHHRPSVVPIYEHRSFDNYDEEFDRGKVRKFKTKDHQYFHRKNPFQKHAERYHRQYNGKFYSNHYNHRKSYDSHSNWKSKHNDSYHKYRNHRQRHY